MEAICREIVSIGQAAELSGLSRSYLYEFIGTGELPTIKIGKRRLVRVETLRAWLASKERQGR